MSHDMRKPVFGAFDLLRLKPACSATETSLSLENSAIANRGIILSRQRTRKALIRLRRCAGWSAPLLYAYGINRFSHDVAQLCFSYICLFRVLLSVFWCHGLAAACDCGTPWMLHLFFVAKFVTVDLNSVSSQCARGKSFIARKPEDPPQIFLMLKRLK